MKIQPKVALNNGTVTCDTFCGNSLFDGYSGGCVMGRCIEAGVSLGQAWPCGVDRSYGSGCNVIECMCSHWPL